MANPISRVFQRYLIPKPVAAVWFSARHRCFVSPRARVQATGRISFGRGTVVKPFAVIQTSGGRVSFGENCAVSSFNHVSTGDADLVIGDDVRFGPNVAVVGSTRNFGRKDTPIVDQGYTHKGIRIGNDVLVGAGASILDGARIGDGAVVGAGAVVSQEVPPYSIVAGVPARVIGERK